MQGRQRRGGMVRELRVVVMEGEEVLRFVVWVAGWGVEREGPSSAGELVRW